MHAQMPSQILVVLAQNPALSFQLQLEHPKMAIFQLTAFQLSSFFKGVLGRFSDEESIAKVEEFFVKNPTSKTNPMIVSV